MLENVENAESPVQGELPPSGKNCVNNQKYRYGIDSVPQPILKTRVPGLHDKPKLKYFGTFWNLSFSAHNGSIGFSFVSTDVRCIFVVHYDFRTSDFESSYLNKKCRSLRDFYQATLYLGQQKLCQKLALFSVPNTKYINFSNGIVFLGHPVHTH